MFSDQPPYSRIPSPRGILEESGSEKFCNIHSTAMLEPLFKKVIKLQPATPAQVFFCELYKVFQNSFFAEQIQETVSVLRQYGYLANTLFS